MLVAYEPTAETRKARHERQAVAGVAVAARSAAHPGATRGGAAHDRADGLSSLLARAVAQRRPAPAAGTTSHARLQRVVEEFEGPGMGGMSFVYSAGIKQLYIETDDNTLWFKSARSTPTQWVLVQVVPSATRKDPKETEHAAYEKVAPASERTVPAPKPTVVQAPVKPAAPPSQIELDLMQHTNHFHIRRLLGTVDELLGKNAIDLVVGDAIKLHGDTVEVKFSVREKSKTSTVVQFVAHYHANATGASTEAHHASQWHLKKWTDKSAHHDPDPSELKYPNLFKWIPKRADAISKARPSKNSGELLYRPK